MEKGHTRLHKFGLRWTENIPSAASTRGPTHTSCFPWITVQCVGQRATPPADSKPTIQAITKLLLLPFVHIPAWASVSQRTASWQLHSWRSSSRPFQYTQQSHPCAHKMQTQSTVGPKHHHCKHRTIAMTFHECPMTTWGQDTCVCLG